MSKVDLTDKERAILWAIGAWFGGNKKRIVTGSLMSKLYSDKNRPILEKYLDKRIDDRIIEVGKYLESKRKETLNND